MKYDFFSYSFRNVQRFTIVAYALILPFIDFLTIKLNGILIMLLSALWLYEVMLKKSVKHILSSRHFYILSGIFLIQILSLFQGGVMNDIVSDLMLKLPFLLFPLLFFEYDFQEEDLRLIKLAFVTGCFIAVVVSLRFLLFQAYQGSSSLNYHSYESYLLLHRPYFGVYLLTALIFIMRMKSFRIASFIVALIFVWFLWFIQAKMACLMLLLLVFIRIMFVVGSNYRRIILVTGIILLGIVFTVGIKYYASHVNHIDQLGEKARFFVLSIDTRLIHWDCAWRILKEHFIAGIGSGNIKASMDSCYQSHHANVYQFVKGFNIHNEFLEEGVRHGMAGLITYLLCFFFFIKVAIQSADRSYLLFLIIVILASLTETTFSREQGVLMIAFFNAIFYLRNINRYQKVESALQINADNSAASFGSK